MDINDWLTDERAQEVVEKTHAVLEQESDRYAKQAMIDAKAGLKRALEKANSLEKENFKLLKYWLKNDEDISANTVMFVERMGKEIKRSLMVTMDTIKHPESLG